MSARLATVLIGVLLFAAACGDSVDDTAGDDAASTDQTDITSTTTTSPSTTEPTGPATDASADEPESTSVDDGRPTLTWPAVAEAAEYQVVVLDANGEPYWSWIGAGTSVPIGGAELGVSTPGPTVAPGFSWTVVAWDVDGAALTLSERVTFVE